jgi:adenosylcobinamide-phosphate synthase
MNYELAIALAGGWLLDLLLGDPERLPHPVVGMGRWIAFWEKRLNKGSHRKAKGALLTVFSLLLCYGFIVMFLHFSHKLSSSIMGSWGEALLIFFCLAGHTLRREVRKVFEALDRSLDEGRRQVARIVGRDTQSLSEQEVRTAALETLAENLSDGVVAPLFWLCLLGVPGMVTYKLVNTFDSMIGYRTPRYKDFGCWAARIDDVANFIPARLTAFLMLIVGAFMEGQQVNGSTGQQVNGSTCWMRSVKRLVDSLTCGLVDFKKRLARSFRFLFRYGPQHASPNSGWPEAALAALLDCRFGGTHDYFGEEVYKPYIGTNPRSLTTRDMRISIRICLAAEVLAVGLALIVVFCFHSPFFIFH